MKLTKSKLKFIIKEEIANLVELGNLSDTYRFKKTQDSSQTVAYNFITEDDYEVDVGVVWEPTKEWWAVSFHVNKDGEIGGFGDIVNHSSTFKVIATIVKIVKQFYYENKERVDKIYFSGAREKTSTNNQRLKVYKRYLKNNLPKNAEVIEKLDSVLIKFGDE